MVAALLIIILLPNTWGASVVNTKIFNKNMFGKDNIPTTTISTLTEDSIPTTLTEDSYDYDYLYDYETPENFGIDEAMVGFKRF